MWRDCVASGRVASGSVATGGVARGCVASGRVVSGRVARVGSGGGVVSVCESVAGGGVVSVCESVAERRRRRERLRECSELRGLAWGIR